MIFSNYSYQHSVTWSFQHWMARTLISDYSCVPYGNEVAMKNNYCMLRDDYSVPYLTLLHVVLCLDYIMVIFQVIGKVNIYHLASCNKHIS